MLTNISLIYLIGILLYQSSILQVKYIIYFASFLILKNSFFLKYSLNQIFLLMFFLMISLINKNLKLFFLILFVFEMKKIEISSVIKMIKQYFTYGILLFIFIILMAKFEIIDPKYYIASSIKIRNGLGFKNPNTAGVYYFILISHYYFFKWNYLKYYDYILILIGEFFLYNYTFSRTGLIVCVFQLMTIITLKNNIKIKNIKKYYFITPFLFYILNIFITFFYTETLNKFMTGRPFTWKMNLLNQKNLLNVFFGSFGEKIIFPLDNSLLNIQFYFGMFSVFIFLYLFCIGLKKMENEYSERSFIIFLSYLVYSLSESMLISPNFGIIQILIMSRALKKVGVKK